MSDVVLIVTGPFIVLIPVFMAGGGSIQDLIELLGLGLLLLCAVAWGVRKLPLARSDAISLEVEKAFWVGLIIVFFVWVAVETL